MVKRIFAAIIGAASVFGIWFGVAKLRAIAAEQDVVTVDQCTPAAFVDCVGYSNPEPIAPPCKAWLGADASVAALSACLHAARARENALKLQQLQRAQAAAKSI